MNVYEKTLMNTVVDTPSAGVHFNGVSVEARVIPASGSLTGGDWCEAFVISEHSIALSIGDICGHGADVFEEKVMLRQVVRDSVARRMNPAKTLAEVNDFIQKNFPSLSASAIFGLLDTSRNELTFSNAGHPAPLMTGYYGQQFLDFSNGDIALGIHYAIHPDVQVISVPFDSLIVFYTDGVTESRRDALSGQRRLRHAARAAYETRSPKPASFIVESMALMGNNYDDAAILTASLGAR